MIGLLLVPLPVLVVLLLVVLASLPWGGAAWVETTLALLAILAIYVWSVRRPRLMPALAVFGCGLALDVLTHGPLGIWCCAALAMAWLGRATRRAGRRFGLVRSALQATLAVLAASLLVNALTSLSAWQLVALEPTVYATAAACIAFPVMAGVMALLEQLWPKAEGRSLFIRGD